MQRVTIDHSQIHHRTIQLTQDQLHYLHRVLRLGSGDRFIALNGQGEGWVASLSPALAQADIIEPWQCQTELSIPVHLVMAMPKAGMDDIVRQTTELGVASITPVISDRTILKPSPKKVERWRRIAQEAIEQCERQWVPTIADPIKFSQQLAPYGDSNSEHSSTSHQRWICVARTSSTEEPPQLLLSALLNRMGQKDVQEPLGAITLAIGPEGGWTPAEVEAAIAQGYEPISLGPRILRAVTAPLGAIATIAAVLDHVHPSLTI